MINYPRPSPAFPYCKQRKARRGLGTRLVIDYTVAISRKFAYNCGGRSRILKRGVPIGDNIGMFTKYHKLTLISPVLFFRIAAAKLS